MDLVDETFVVAHPSAVAAAVHDPARWRGWWPDLRLDVFMDRGETGIRWTVSGALVGSLELWLEPVGDGVVVHHYLRADATRAGSPRRAAGEIRRRTLSWKRAVNALKDELERGRPPGAPRIKGEPIAAEE